MHHFPSLAAAIGSHFGEGRRVWGSGGPDIVSVFVGCVSSVSTEQPEVANDGTRRLQWCANMERNNKNPLAGAQTLRQCRLFIIALARGFLRAVLDKRCSYGFMRLYDRIFAAKMLILCQRERDFQLRMQH